MVSHQSTNRSLAGSVAVIVIGSLTAIGNLAVVGPAVLGFTTLGIVGLRPLSPA